jgi:hypothetical protein
MDRLHASQVGADSHRHGKCAYALALVDRALPFRTSIKGVAFSARCGEHSEACGRRPLPCPHAGIKSQSPQHKGRQR